MSSFYVAALMSGAAACPAAAQQASTSAPGAPSGTSAGANTIVVTAAGFEQDIRTAPASISVIGREELETQPFRDLTDALRSVEGVAVTGGSNEQEIYIRGLGGSYTLLLVDGRRQSTRDSRTNGNSGYEQSFMPPVEAIERIEVVRGPMSSLYGSDAIGGVINVITRKIPDKWGGSLSADYTLQLEDDYGDNSQIQGYLAGPVLDDKVGLQFWGRRYHREEARILNGFNGAEDTDLNGRIALRPADGHEIMIEAGTQRIRREGTPGRVLADNGTANYNTNDRDHYAVWYDGRVGEAVIWASVQQEETQRYSYSRSAAEGAFVRAIRAPNVRNRVADLRISMPVMESLMLVTGGQYTHTRLIDQNPGSGSPIQQRFTIDQLAGFIEAEWKILPGFSLTGGARLDDHQIYGSHWSPRIYGVWEPVTNLIVKGGVTTGFRAPDIRMIAPGYAYTTGGPTCTVGPNGTCAVIVGDPDLGAEKSTSYEVSISYDNRSDLNLGVTLFHTDLRDRVSDVQRLDENGNFLRWSEDPNYRLYEWVNINKAMVRGLEATGRWKPAEDISLRAGYTFTDSEQKSGAYAGYALARTPRHMANGRIEWTPNRAFTAFAAGWYHGREINAQLRAGFQGTPVLTPEGRIIRVYPDYFLADVGASYRMSNGVLINMTMQNITNKRLDDMTYNMVNDGRRLWIGTSVRF